MHLRPTSPVRRRQTRHLRLLLALKLLSGTILVVVLEQHRKILARSLLVGPNSSIRNTIGGSMWIRALAPHARSGFILMMRTLQQRGGTLLPRDLLHRTKSLGALDRSKDTVGPRPKDTEVGTLLKAMVLPHPNRGTAAGTLLRDTVPHLNRTTSNLLP